MSAFSARVVQHSINQLLINTINDAEKMLLDLPRDGDRVEVITSSSHEVGTYNRQRKTTQDVVVDHTSKSDSHRSNERKEKDRPISSDTEESKSSGSEVPQALSTPPQHSVQPPRPHSSCGDATPPAVQNMIRDVLPDKAKIVPGSIQISPLKQMDGITIDLVVMIKMKSGGSRTVEMQIECPQFTPRRIRVDGVWHNIA
ncbi:hypothetical protein Q1695_012434 [Nippostrongylus brasiliensis]|nr:hypothetical protein Q1695_012434 [Nippostrongylus brasiliensis]